MTKKFRVWSERKDPQYAYEPTDRPIKSAKLLGYMCKECKNNVLFRSDFIYYRRYVYNAHVEEFDFQYEYLLPISIACHRCGSPKVYCEYAPGLVFSANEKINSGGFAFRSVASIVYNFADADGWIGLFTRMKVSDPATPAYADSKDR